MLSRPEIKVCGITRSEDAACCRDNGIDALGFMFYDKSKRAISADQAAVIITEVGEPAAVGVFVNSPAAEVAEIAATAQLDYIQLHGSESPEYLTELRRLTALPLIKCLFLAREPNFSRLTKYQPLCHAILVESGAGGDWGGTGQSWDATPLRSHAEGGNLIVAGGLTPANLEAAATTSGCAAFDLSSGVESAPGKKDHRLIAELGTVAARLRLNQYRRIFS